MKLRLSKFSTLPSKSKHPNVVDRSAIDGWRWWGGWWPGRAVLRVVPAFLAFGQDGVIGGFGSQLWGGVHSSIGGAIDDKSPNSFPEFWWWRT